MRSTPMRDALGLPRAENAAKFGCGTAQLELRSVSYPRSLTRNRPISGRDFLSRRRVPAAIQIRPRCSKRWRVRYSQSY
jgi:hypothetical protein